MKVLQLLKRIGRFFWPSPAMRWDWRAQEMRDEGLTEREIARALGPRPKDGA